MAKRQNRAGTTQPKASIRTLWGIAKSEELRLCDEDLYALLYRETGKEHMHELTQRELDRMARVLQNLRDGVQRDIRHKRTDEGGNPQTEAQRRKIYALCEVLGWNDNPARINGFAKRVYHVDRIEWLSPSQCRQVIEALKKMIERKEREDGSRKEADDAKREENKCGDSKGAPGEGDTSPGKKTSESEEIH